MAIVISVDDDDNDDVDEEEEEEAGTGEDASTDEEAGGKGVRGSSVLAIAMAKSANSVFATWSRFVPYCTSWRPRRLASKCLLDDGFGWEYRGSGVEGDERWGGWLG